MIRRAEFKDVTTINNLLMQVLDVHHQGRPDIFKKGTKKYTDDELCEILNDNKRPVFVYEEDGKVLGYCFCVFQQYIDNNILTDIKTLYIDDLCVDENARGKHVGTQLFEYVKNYAKEQKCYNVTLNVWAENKNALKFYEKHEFKPQKIGMEIIL